MPDTTAPTFVSAATSGDGAEVQLTYSETLGSTTAPPSAFNVSVDGSQASIARATTSGSNVILSLTSSIQPGQSVSVGYTAPPPNNSVTTNSAVQDAAGNDASSLNPTTATNNSTALSNSSLNFSSTSIATRADSVPQDVAAADFNSDGILDLAVADAKASDPRARIYLGDGTGGFTAGSSQPVGLLPWSITANDFDGDGDADVATANTNDNSVSVLLGDGNGNLSAASTINGGPTVPGANPKPRYIINLDCNLDGRTDLAWTISYGPTTGGKLGVLINNDSPNPFLGVAPTFYTIGTNPYGLVATDLNSDGKADLIAANSPTSGGADVNGSISVLLSNGDDTFQSAQSTSVGIKPRYLSSGDYNRDGKQDLALTLSEDENKVQILLGNGSGGFSSPTSYALGSDSGPRDVISDDFNADGILDLAISTIYADSISVLRGNSNGSFGTRKVFAAGDGPLLMASGDFNRDGHPDLAIANNDSSNFSILLNRTTIQRSTGSGGITTATNLEVSRTPADNTPQGVTVQAIDSDGDGLREAITDRTGRIIDGNRDGIADAEQAHVTGLRLMSDGSFSTDYGAVAASDGVILSDAHCITPSDNGHFSVIARDGATVEAALPYGVTDRFIGAVSFTLSGIAAGTTTTGTIHLPSGLSESPNAYIRFNYLTNQFEDYTDAQGKPLYALIDSDSDGKTDAIELNLTDGDLRWDRDGVANGIIEDPGFAASAELVIRGEQTDDELIGNVLANTLIGPQGNDILIGDLGNDRIRGGVGNDLLLGGRGSDTLKGGPGNDRYLFEQASDSAPGLRDRVYFGQGDRFDLRAIDANINLDGQQTFQFLNNAAFTGTAGELRASQSVLQADLNGDAVADFSVQLHSGIRLSAANLML